MFAQKNSKLIITIVSIVTMFILFFGLSNFEITRHISDTMITCPFMEGHTSVCDMSPIEHMQAFQNMFTILPVKHTTLFFYTLLFLLILIVLNLFRKLFVFNDIKTKTLLDYFLKRILIFNPIKDAFSNGILNPKIF